ncbi:unnamed protein product [Polarella glacialis]|uniref:Uncharacterized protein n=1 Tax=Polarella glacialis TaxID=89957 RepID=A0A813ERR3_POLGL|nr:unnamed protein product [Polarella glacialis]
MDRRGRIAAQRGYAGLLRLVRQWEATDTVATNELEKIMDSLTRLDYISPPHVGLLGIASLNAQAATAAHSSLKRRGQESSDRLVKFQAEMESIVTSLDELAEEVSGNTSADVLPQPGPVRLSACDLPAALGAVRAGADALRKENALRRSLLAALEELRSQKGAGGTSQAEDERRRLLLVWSERPYTCAEEGSQLSLLKRRSQDSLERLEKA